MLCEIRETSVDVRAYLRPSLYLALLAVLRYLGSSFSTTMLAAAGAAESLSPSTEAEATNGSNKVVNNMAK
jgi:hypothetical protein